MLICFNLQLNYAKYFAGGAMFCRLFGFKFFALQL